MKTHILLIKVLEHLRLCIMAAAVMFVSMSAATAGEWNPQVKTVKVNNYDLAYVERGKGKPLILVHGGLSDYRTWLPLMTELSENSRTIAVSLRHFYPERWNGQGKDFTMQQHADDIAGFIKAMQLEKVGLVGHSRGGVVAMLVASQNPELVDKLVLADPSPLQSMLSNYPKAAKFMNERRKTMEETVGFYRNGKPEQGLIHFVNYIAGAKAWEKTSDKRKSTLRDNTWTQVSHVRDLDTPFNCSMARNVSSPVLMITGERSAPLYGYMLSALKSCFRQVSNALIADAGHMMYSNNPTAFIFEVQDFVAPQ